MADPRLPEQFPDDFFPPSLEEFRQSAARSIGVADEYMAGPMLAAASVSIGTAQTAVLKPGWDEPASLFVAAVGYMSSGKTPAFKHALKPLAARQAELEKHAAEQEEMPDVGLADGVGCESGDCCACSVGDESCCEVDEEDEGDEEIACGGCSGDGDVVISSPNVASLVSDPSSESWRPLIIKDTTHAALWDALETSRRGVIVNVDELSTVFLQSTPAQRQIWCEIYQAESRTIHRKTNRRGPIVLPRTFVTLAGGIPPDLFPSIRGKYDGGLLERFLICGKPETSLPPWSDEVVDPTAEMAWDLAVVALLDIEKAAYTGPEERRGCVLFTRAAYERLHALRDSLEANLLFRGVHVKHHGVVRKLVANAARLALVRRCVRWAVGQFGFYGPVGVVEEDDCDAACRAAEFFLNRYLLWRPEILATAADPKVAPASRPTSLTDRILAYAASKGKKTVEVRWLRQQTLEGNPSTSAIRAALDEAAASGRGRWADRAKKIFIRG